MPSGHLLFGLSAPGLDDILKARVTTLGPEEHTVVAENGAEKSNTWTIYDVGGSTNQRGEQCKW